MDCQVVINDVRDALRDPVKVSWPDPLLLAYLSQALLALTGIRPDAFVVNAVLKLEAGSKQTLPVNGLRLMGLLFNADDANKPVAPAIRHIEQLSLDDVLTSWLSQNPELVCHEYWYNETDPKRFWTNPVQNNVKVIANYVASPARVTDGATPFPIDDSFIPAIQEWMLYLAWRSDDEKSPTAQRALTHRQAFFDLLGVKAAADVSVSPKRTGG